MNKDSNKQLLTLESVEEKIQKKKNEIKTLEKQRDRILSDAVKKIMVENSMKTKDFFEYLKLSGLLDKDEKSAKENSAQIEQNS